MGEILLVAAFLLFGSKKKSSDDTSKLPSDDKPVDKPPEPTASAPAWTGRVGQVSFSAKRGRGAWVSWVAGVGTNNHATAFLALRAAMTGASAVAPATASVQLMATPGVFDATSAPVQPELWHWHVVMPEAGTPTIDGNNDAIAEGNVDSRDAAIAQILTWARPATEGRVNG